jgi:hypothetical protein
MDAQTKPKKKVEKWTCSSCARTTPANMMYAQLQGKAHRQPGDSLVSRELLVEIETDKAQMDFEFQAEGVVAKIQCSLEVLRQLDNHRAPFFYGYCSQHRRGGGGGAGQWQD